MKLPMCLIVFMVIYFVPFIGQCSVLPLLVFSDHQGKCLKHLHHLCSLLLQAVSTGIADNKKNSIFIDFVSAGLRGNKLLEAESKL